MILLVVGSVSGQDIWDVDCDYIPPVISQHFTEKPRLFEGPNLLKIEFDDHNRITISIAPNPEKQIPVFYTLKTKDSLVNIELFTRGNADTRRLSRFKQPKGYEFQIQITYKESPNDSAIFRVYRLDENNSWSIEAIHTTDFIVLQPSEKKE